MEDNDKILIQGLTESFSRQLVLYQELNEAVAKILSRLVLSRGDISSITGDFEKKQQLLDAIDTERKSNAGRVSQWQDRKQDIGPEAAANLNGILEQTQVVIKKFLEQEDQVKKYLERILKNAPGAHS